MDAPFLLHESLWEFFFLSVGKKGHCVSRFDTFWHIKNESGNSDPHFMASSGKWQMTSRLFYIITCMEMSFCALTLNTISVFTIWTSKYLLFSNHLLSFFLFLGKHQRVFIGVQLLNEWLKRKNWHKNRVQNQCGPSMRL